jgi:hypothetical protein
MRLLLACALVAAALPMAAQTTSATASGKASVVILPADVSITHADARSLNFGTFNASGEVQTRTIDPPPPTGSKVGDYFTFKKDKNEVAIITVAPNCTLTNPEQKVGLTSTLTYITAGNDEANTEGSISVGGTITIPAWTRKGLYAGTYDVTISYSL